MLTAGFSFLFQHVPETISSVVHDVDVHDDASSIFVADLYSGKGGEALVIILKSGNR